MDLSRIRIEGLFGRFNYDISLKRPEKITIIHAPNGSGKTVLLTLVNAFLKKQFDPFFKYNFQKLHLYFDEGPSVEISKMDDPTLFQKVDTERDRKSAQVVIASSGQETYRLRPIIEDQDIDPEDFLPITRVGPDEWMDDETSDIYSRAEVFQKYESSLPAHLRKRVDIPEWLQTILGSTDCHLIETQRLLRMTRQSEPRRPRRLHRLGAPVVEMEARDLADRIRLNLAEYANASQRLDQSFPWRVIQALGSEDAPSTEEASQRFHSVENKRVALIEAGLLDQAGAPEFLPRSALEGGDVRRVMGVYLHDMEQKLSKFDQLFARVSLFQEIISEKFQFKKLSVSRTSGITVKTDTDQSISLSDLSSGEQHELVLLYELLFGVRENALILIDEPELSLHVAWQLRFLPDLERIQKLKPIQVIMATHSPQIINDRWDLTVELKR